jgi:hypothetical protein
MCIMMRGSCIRLLDRKPEAARQRRCNRPWFEILEQRLVLSSTIYSVDGSGNNLSDPSRFNWGSVGQDLLRMATAPPRWPVRIAPVLG